MEELETQQIFKFHKQMINNITVCHEKINEQKTIKKELWGELCRKQTSLESIMETYQNTNLLTQKQALLDQLAEQKRLNESLREDINQTQDQSAQL